MRHRRAAVGRDSLLQLALAIVVGVLLYVGFFGWIVWRAVRLSRFGPRDVTVFSIMCNALLTLLWLYASLIVAVERMVAPGATRTPMEGVPAG
jgi:hypothetical protein